MEFTVPADHRIKLKENEKKNHYLDLAKELEKLWNMRMTVIPIVISAVCMAIKGLLKVQEELQIRVRLHPNYNTVKSSGGIANKSTITSKLQYC